MNDTDHTCGMTVRGASTCPACLSRPVEGAPPPSRWDRFQGRKDGKWAASLKPYSDEPDRDSNGLKKGAR